MKCTISIPSCESVTPNSTMPISCTCIIPTLLYYPLSILSIFKANSNLFNHVYYGNSESLPQNVNCINPGFSTSGSKK